MADPQDPNLPSTEQTPSTVADEKVNASPIKEMETQRRADLSAQVANPITADSESEADLPAMPTDEAQALQGLTEDIQNQDDLERGITRQANQAMIEQEDERDKKRISKAKDLISKLRNDEQTLIRRRDTLRQNPLQQRRIATELDKLHTEILAAQDDVEALQNRIDDRHQLDDQEQENAEARVGKSQRLPNETQREFLLRTGKITPFSSMAISRVGLQQGGLDELMVDAEEDAELELQADAPGGQMSHRNLHAPGFGAAYDSDSTASVALARRKKKRRVDDKKGGKKARSADNSEYGASGDDFNPDQESDDDDDLGTVAADGAIKKKGKKRAHEAESTQDNVDLSSLDDGNEGNYKRRLREWVKRRSHLRKELAVKDTAEEKDAESSDEDEIEEEEWHKSCPNPDTPDHLYNEGVKLPGEIYSSLFDYQRIGVQWLGEMFAQNVGGILADEMGLGKTIQVVSFIAGLHFSKKLDGPVIVVAPATVLSQWVKEFHAWWPPLRVSILHSSGSGMLNLGDEEYLSDEREFDSRYGKASKKASPAAKRIADTVVKKGHVLVTTYAGLQTYKDLLIPIKWSYAVLDEGHKIRNPESIITYSCKSLQTSNRVILSGTPMQNNLVELWSLFDFVYPMRLSTLVNFRDQFETPIKIGGYANATNMQVLAAEKCAQTLKEAISPYLMQRLKADVASDLPKKSELVLFCKLTKPQREAYDQVLASPEIASVLNGERNSLWGIDMLTKICNHPDLMDDRLRKLKGENLKYKWGNPNKSGKMQVVKNLLNVWKDKENKVLIFSQGKLMLNILEEFVGKKLGFGYLRMDGDTPVKNRQKLVDRFNTDPDIFVFLLTTKVGGLGVNLTGANRVIIFDPNWNPSTDMQARERAWRLGQKREVSIFRLMTAGSIEEKIYHRQIYKQFLTNKILKDPSQRPAFQKKNLLDLFTLGDTTGTGTETGSMFKGTEVEFGSSAASSPGEGSSSAPNSRPTTSNGGPSQHQGPSPPAAAEDFSTITGIASTEAFREDKPTNAEEEEGRFMAGLFARSGVRSALSHDEIINGRPASERSLLERYANSVAREAGETLRRAGEQARHVPAGQVTWTGTQGEVGRPIAAGSRRTAGPGSAGVRANLEHRQNPGATSAGSSSAGPSPAERQRWHAEFVRLLTRFINSHNTGGLGVPTKMIVDHFNPLARSEERKEEFKKVFNEIAVAKEPLGPNRQRGGNRPLMKRWVLRQ